MQIEDLPTEKFCKKCSTTKPAKDFSIAKSHYKGNTYYSLQNACKSCVALHAKEYAKTHPRTYRPKSRIETVEELNLMKSPLNWFDMKHNVKSYEYKEYPICELGHKYVGKECLPCKYHIPINVFVDKIQL